MTLKMLVKRYVQLPKRGTKDGELHLVRHTRHTPLTLNEMKHKPEDLDNVEWYYLIQYFGSERFQVHWCPVSFVIPLLNTM